MFAAPMTARDSCRQFEVVLPLPMREVEEREELRQG